VPIDFLRGLDLRLVASSRVVDGVREDVLSAEGQRVLTGAVEVATDLPASVSEVLFLTTSIYDAHPDHRVAYRVAREAARILAEERGLSVEVWSWIVHDEVPSVEIPACCPGDFHWPSAGPRNDHLALTDVSERPRPPLWSRVEDVGDLADVRRRALQAHVSQVEGNPDLCMPVYVPSFYERWLEKVEEPFYEEAP
jgi:LmbE family N-acetylglucosaminyl deacetylase